MKNLHMHFFTSRILNVPVEWTAKVFQESWSKKKKKSVQLSLWMLTKKN